MPCKRQESHAFIYVRRVCSFRVRVFSVVVYLIYLFIVSVPLFFVLGFLHIVYLAFDCNFASVLRCAWSSLQLSVWVFARPNISSLFRYSLISTSFVSFAFPVCLIGFAQFEGYFILTLYLFNCSLSVPLYFTSLGFISHRFASSCFGSLVSPVVEVLI